MKIIETIKKAISRRFNTVKPLGLWTTRALVLLILVSILLVIFEYIFVCIRGCVNDDAKQIIDTGLKIIDHIFVPSVLASLIGFLSLFLDRNNNGIPDSLEKGENKNDK